MEWTLKASTKTEYLEKFVPKQSGGNTGGNNGATGGNTKIQVR